MFLIYFMVVCVTLVFLYSRLTNKKYNLPPGPSGLPILGYLPFLGPEPYRKLDQLKEKYGNVFSLYLGRNFVVILGDYIAMRDALGQSATSDRPPKQIDVIPDGAGLSSLNGEEWSEQRRFCVKSMRDVGLGKDRWESIIEEEVENFVALVSSYNGQAVKISEDLLSSVVNNISSFIIGEHLPAQSEFRKKMDGIMADAFRALNVASIFQFFPSLRDLLIALNIGQNKNINTVLKKFNQYIRDEVKKIKDSRGSNESFIKDYLDQMDELKDKQGHSFNDVNLYGNTQSFFLAGSDTTKSSLEWLFLIMATYPVIQTKVQNEIDAVLQRKTKVKWVDRYDLPYTLAVIMEGQRWRTLAPLNIPRLVRLGTKYTVVLNDWSSVKEILTNPAALDRGPNIFDHIPEIGFISANGKEWVEQRRFCISTVRDLGVGKGPWETIISDELQNFVGLISKAEGKPVDISHSISSSISSNIVSFLVGRRLSPNEESEKVQLAVDFSDVSFTYMGPSNPTSVMPWLRKYLEFFKIDGYDRTSKIIRGFTDFVRDEIVRHKSSEFQEVNDFINTYLKKIRNIASATFDKHHFSETNLLGNVNILFLAASDTIYSSVGWVMRLMVKHPEIQEKVHKELMEVLGKDGVARYEERHKLPYTFAVIMESQRFSSIVPLSTTRRANQDINVRNMTIPKGAEIVANLWALHNDPKYWDKPEEFRPERFLLNEGTTLVKNPESYAPFSIGRRNCPGETIAYMEILLYFSEIIKKFKIMAPPGEKPEFKIVNGLVAHLEPQHLCFKEREENI